MKIRPVILCGGAGTRLWPESKKNVAKQFIDFGGWTLFEKALERVKNPIFESPIISTNLKYLKQVKKFLKKKKILKYKILLEPSKKNTAPAILVTALINEINDKEPLMYFSADHLIEKYNKLNKSLNLNKKNLDNKNIFIFGIKPKTPSSEYGYFITKKNKKIYNVKKFIEKPNTQKAKIIIKKKGYWNSGMFFLRKDSLIYNFKKYQPQMFKNCTKAIRKAKLKNNIYYIDKKSFNCSVAKSFDYAILEKTKDINSINLDIPWSDLGSWREISKMYNRNKFKLFKKKNIFYRPWGKYINLYVGKGFLVKEIFVKPKASLSLQKHFYRSEHWMITAGKPKITINNKFFFEKSGNSVFIPKGAIHRIENPFKKIVKIIEIQLGSILRENDIVRYDDIYGRLNRQ